MKKRNNGLSFIVSCNKFGWTRSWNIGRDRFQLILVIAGIFALGTFASSFYSYKFYGEAEALRAEKEAEINELLNTVNSIPNEIIIENNLDKKFAKRVLKLEKRLSAMEKKLSSKKRKRKLSIGGRGFRATDINNDYFDAVEKDIDRLADTIAIIPVGKPVSGKITSRYGYRNSPFSKHTREFHGGIDFRGKIGEEVVATADGVVENAASVSDYGKYIIIKHKKGYKTLYAHLSKIEVTKGQRVAAGEKIGEIGSTGRSTGPHLHYEIKKNGKRINPIKYVR